MTFKFFRASGTKEKKNIELTYTIDAGKRYRIRKIATNIDPVFDKEIFEDLGEEFSKFAGEILLYF